MGYDVHITRKAHWAEEHGPGISMDEWQQYVDDHPECHWFEIAGRKQKPDDAVVVYDSSGSELGPIWWQGGEVRTKNPPLELVSYMIGAANMLNARVMGDDGETYRDANRPDVFRPPYVNPNNHTNVWEESPEGYDDEYHRRRSQDRARQDTTGKLPGETAVANTPSVEKKIVFRKRIGAAIALFLLLWIAIKAFR